MSDEVLFTMAGGEARYTHEDFLPQPCPRSLPGRS
jgi:hypothetical protein